MAKTLTSSTHNKQKECTFSLEQLHTQARTVLQQLQKETFKPLFKDQNTTKPTQSAIQKISIGLYPPAFQQRLLRHSQNLDTPKKATRHSNRP